VDAQHAELDPVRLLSEIRAAQQALMELADMGPAADAAAVKDKPSLDAFLASLRHAWKEGEVRPTARPKAGKPRGRRRPDPLKDVTAELETWFQADPGITGRQLLEKLQAALPDAYPDKLLRTVQRRLKVWRRESARALVLNPSSTIDPRPGFSDGALRYAGGSARRRRTPSAEPPPSLRGRAG
jgi:hypothetical protein